MADSWSPSSRGPGPRRVTRYPGGRWHWAAGRGTVIETAAAAAPLRLLLIAPAWPGHALGGPARGLAQALATAGQELTMLVPLAAGGGLPVLPGVRVEALPLPALPEPRLAAAAAIDLLAAWLRAALAAGRRWDRLHAFDGLGANALAQLQAQGRLDAWLRSAGPARPHPDPVLRRFQRRGLEAATALRAHDAAAAASLLQGWGLLAPPLAPQAEAATDWLALYRGLVVPAAPAPTGLG